MPKRQTRRQRKKGGAFVRKGSYGCAFAKPPLKCQGESSRRSSNELSKLLEYKKAVEEYQESIPFQKIDPEKRYFLWAHHICPLDKSSVLPANRIEKCIQRNAGQAAPTVNIRRDPTLIFYDFGGRDISDITITSGQYGPFFLSFGNLLEGLSIMHYNHIAHLDIKPLNIVSMETPTGEFLSRFIDFGLAVSTASGTSRNPRILGLSPQNYPWWPFDFRFLSRDNNRIVPAELNKWYDQLTEMRSYLPQSSYWKSDWTPKYNNVHAQIAMNEVDWAYREEILQKLDVYALGMSLTEVYATKTHQYMRTYDGVDTIVIQLPSRMVIPVSKLTKDHVGGDSAIVLWHKNLAEKVSIPFYNLIKQMVDFSPRKRITANKASEYFNLTLVAPIMDFFDKFDTFTQRALSAVGVRVEYSKLKLQLSPKVQVPPVPTAPAPTIAPTVPALPVSAPSSATRPTNIQALLREAEKVLGANAPAVSNLAPTTMKRFPRARPEQPHIPLRQGISGPQKTGLNVLRKIAPPPVPQPVAKPKELPSNMLKSNRTRKFRFPWEKMSWS